MAGLNPQGPWRIRDELSVWAEILVWALHAGRASFSVMLAVGSSECDELYLCHCPDWFPHLQLNGF